MKYAIRQKLVSFGDDFTVKDERGKDVYFVDGRAFSFGKQLAFQDMQRNELAFISQRFATFLPTFRILKNGKTEVTVKKRLFTFRPQFSIKFVSGAEWTIVGNLIWNDYKMYDGKEVVGEVSKRILTFSDCYGVDVRGNADPVIVICLAIVIDMVLHSKDKERK